MVYTYESQRRALNFLIQNTPHDMDKFKALYSIDVEGDEKAEINLKDILFNDIWTASEKEELIKLYRHNDNTLSYPSSWDYNFADECIKRHNYSGLVALLNLGNTISVDSIKTIIEYIKDPKERYKYCELLVNYYKNANFIKAHLSETIFYKKIPSLCDLYGEYDFDTLTKTFSSMEDICCTNDLELVKLFLPTVKNIKPLFRFAVETGNTEIVKLFIESGADVNYQDLEFETRDINTYLKTPIKIAIDNNDLEMVKFLYENGADLNYIDQSNKMQEMVNDLGTPEEKQTHQYKKEWNTQKYIGWNKIPLEYAINLGATSIINIDPINVKRNNEPISKQYEDRVAIVKYLYENGATFSNSELNYTDLICFAIKSSDFALTEYFFDEALKNNKCLNFEKIISFIHNPCLIENKHHIIYYKDFKDGAKPWFRMCEEYSKKMNKENHKRNLKLMLEKIFKSFKYDDYKEFIIKYSNELPDEIKKQIPAVFGVKFDNLEETLGLGYDINCSDENYNSLLMIYTKYSGFDEIEKFISLGADPNYQNLDGESTLSEAILRLPKWDFGKFISNFDKEIGELYKNTEEYEKFEKSLVYKLVDLVNKDIISSEKVKEAVYSKIKPGYPQIIYSEVLSKLSKKGFKVDDKYFTESLAFLNETYSHEYVTNPWEYLWNLYHSFDNVSINTHLKFPIIEKVKDIKYGTKQSEKVFTLINEHLKRNFVTSIDQIKDPNKRIGMGTYFNPYYGTEYNETSKTMEQDYLLEEISRYIGHLDYRYIISLIDNYPIIDKESIIRNKLLINAIRAGDIKLCHELVKRGSTIICYDENGKDVTLKTYTPKELDIYQSLNKEYNPNWECEELLAKIGCDAKVLSKKRNIMY